MIQMEKCNCTRAVLNIEIVTCKYCQRTFFFKEIMDTAILKNRLTLDHRWYDSHTRDETERKTPNYATKPPVKDERKENSSQHAQVCFVTLMVPSHHPVIVLTQTVRIRRYSGRMAWHRKESAR